MMSHRLLYLTLVVTLFGVVAVIVAGGPRDVTEDLPAQTGATVEIGVARAAAAAALPAFLEGSWGYFDHLVYYDPEGTVAGYAIVFVRSVPGPQNAVAGAAGGLAGLEPGLRELRETSRLLSAEMERVRGSVRGGDDPDAMQYAHELVRQKQRVESAMFYLDEFATVLTAARDDMPPIVKCYQGLPVAFVKQAAALSRMNDEEPGGNWVVERFLCIDRFTEGVQVVESPSPPPIGEDAGRRVVNLRTRETSSLETLRQQRLDQRRMYLLRSLQEGAADAEWEAAAQRNRARWRAWKERVRTESPQSIVVPDAGEVQ